MRIGEAAGSIGVETSAIRFYEEKGVVPEPGRTPSGYREYSDQDVDLLRFVKRARGLGISLDDIREIVALRIAGKSPCPVVREVISDEARSIEARIDDLEDLRRELLRLEAMADEITSESPTDACVCHIIEG